MLLLVYASGVYPFAEADPPLLSADDEGVIEVGHTDEYGGIVDALLVSADDERLIVVEEFAYCGDGRAVYLQHSTKPVEIGETFAWEYHQSADDPDGDIRMVSIAEPDSPITHDGPDPKKDRGEVDT